MWATMHAQQCKVSWIGIIVCGSQSYMNRDYSVLEQKERHAIVSCFKLIRPILLFGFIMMFDTGMFLLSFDTDYIGWKHWA